MGKRKRGKWNERNCLLSELGKKEGEGAKLRDTRMDGMEWKWSRDIGPKNKQAALDRLAGNQMWNNWCGNGNCKEELNLGDGDAEIEAKNRPIFGGTIAEIG